MLGHRNSAVAVIVALLIALVASSCHGGAAVDAPPTTAVPPASARASTAGPSVALRAGDSIQSAVDAHPPGTTFVLDAGVYRQSVVPKDRDAFVGLPGAVMSGARVLSGWVRHGSVWSLAGVTEHGDVVGDCGANPTCGHPEALFRDDITLDHVDRRSAVGPGRWYLDYGQHVAYVGDDPEGHTMEISSIPYAFSGPASGVSITGLVVEKYANPAQAGAVKGDDSSTGGWQLANDVFRLNHGAGLTVKDGSTVRNSSAYSNGQIGLEATGANVMIDAVQLYGNNTAGFSMLWEAGGAKFWKTTNLTVQDCAVHDNAGYGLWTDTDNVNTLYQRNTVERNVKAGIHHEISYAAIIRNNVIRDNGADQDLSGSGIYIAASRDVEIYGNVLVDNGNGIVALQQDRGSGSLGPHRVQNLYVHDNLIEGHRGTGYNGLEEQVDDASYFTSRHNRWQANRYQGTGGVWLWADEYLPWSQWQAAGQDRAGAYSP